MIHITAHAIQRALERVPGLKSAHDARRLLSTEAVNQAAQFAAHADVWVRIGTGQHIAIRDGFVTTVLPSDLDMRKMSSAASRYRDYRRAHALAHWTPAMGLEHRGNG